MREEGLAVLPKIKQASPPKYLHTTLFVKGMNVVHPYMIISSIYCSAIATCCKIDFDYGWRENCLVSR